MDPNEEEVITNAPEGEPAAPAPEAPAAPAEPETPEAEPEAPSQEEEPEKPEPGTGSRRLDKRIERFSMKLRNEFVNRQPQPSQGDPYKPADLSEMEYDPDTLKLLEEDRKRIGEDAYRRGAGERQTQVQERFMDRFEVDADRVTGKYAVMNEESDDFDPDFAASLNAQYLALVGYDERTGVFHNPVIRYKDYVDSQMALIERASATKNADTAQEVAKQVSRTGVRPTGGSRKVALDLSPAGIRKMSPEEYEKNRPAIEAEIRRTMGV